MYRLIQVQRGERDCDASGQIAVVSDAGRLFGAVPFGKSRLFAPLRSWQVVFPATVLSSAILLTLCSVMAQRAAGHEVRRIDSALTKHVVVGRGESLWSLARHYGDPEVSIQDRVDLLSHLNGLKTGAPLMAGQRLLVPVSPHSDISEMRMVLASR